MKSSERKKDLRAKPPVELQKELMELLSAQFKLRMQKATQQLTNTSQIRRTRRDIARVRTMLAQADAKSANTGAKA
ncbi:MAG: 50S ribosomal protein L29 [Betaproteobacteria bacterium]|nr:50S ribosomal protein L29 [Betaproteobacteria bacterium]